MSRIEKLHPDTLNEAQMAIYDGIVGGKRAAGPQLFNLTDEQGRLNGPFNALLLSPAVGASLSAVGEAIRFGSDIPVRMREIAILVVAREYECEFEWYAHKALGRHIGLSEKILEALKNGENPNLDDEEEQVQYDFCVQLVRTRKTDEELYIQMKEIAGEAGILELTSLVGYYTTLALIMNVYDIGVPDGVETVFDK